MALENLQSKYGPYNKKGQKGTGEIRDREDGKGLAVGGSKYQTSEKIGVKPTGTDPFGNIPAERSFE